MTDAEIAEVRGIVRLEALRASVFSVASESLDSNTPRLRVLVDLENDSFAASFEYLDRAGRCVTGGAL